MTQTVTLNTADWDTLLLHVVVSRQFGENPETILKRAHQVGQLILEVQRQLGSSVPALDKGVVNSAKHRPF